MLGEYDTGYENYIDSLIREIEKLQDENDKLSEQVSSFVGRSFRTADKMSCIEAENAKLRELVLVLKNCADENGDCDACPINDAKPVRHPWFGCDALRDMMRELGVDE